MKFKVIAYTLLMVFLFYFSIFMAGLLPFIAENRSELGGPLILGYLIEILLNPIKNIKLMHEAGNPLLYICFGAALFLFIYLLYKSRSKEYENVGERYGVQGSSRWAKKSEILNVPDQITVINSNDMYDYLNQSLNDKKVK